MEREKVIDLVRKLLKLSSSPKEEEAKLALAKVQELLLKYNLQMEQIPVADRTDSLMARLDIPSDRVKWKELLVHYICNANFCKSISSYTKEGVSCESIVGRQYNIEVVLELILWIMPQANRWELQKLYLGKRDRAQFMYGLVDRIGERLKEQKNSYSAETKALIVDIEQEVERFYHKEFPRAYSTTRIVGGVEYRNGRNAGKGISLSGSSSQLQSRHLLK